MAERGALTINPVRLRMTFYCQCRCGWVEFAWRKNNNEEVSYKNLLQGDH